MVKALLITPLLLFGFATLMFAPPVEAQNFCDNEDAQRTEFCRNQSTGTATDNTVVGPNGVLTRVVDILSIIVGIAAVIAIVIGGLMLTVSNGDSGQISKGRQTIIYGLVGIVVAIFARAIVAFVLNRL